jgi:hypothetical protein
MRTPAYLNLLLFLFVLAACHIEKELVLPAHYQSKASGDLRFDGLYTVMDTTRLNDGLKLNEYCVYVCPIRFFENGFFDSKHSVFRDDTTFQMHHKKACYKKGHSNQGKYIVRNDTLYMSGKFIFFKAGQFLRYYPAHFKAVVKGGDSLLNFQMTAPYPNLNFEENKRNIPILTPYKIIFKPLAFDSIVDPEKLWIIEELKQQNKSR